MAETVYLASLGCAKNLVNSEQMLALIRQAGMTITQIPEEATVAVVNTCGFIDSAKSEAIETILKLAQLKEEGDLKALVVTGCLTERYREEVLAELPEVDAVCGTGSYTDVVSAIRDALEGKRTGYFAPQETAALGGDRSLLTPKYSAYLRIAEGCDNKCSYCVIPSLRGPFRSRPMEELIEEAKKLAADGCKELLIIAQDISRYGTDLYGERRLYALLEQLCRIEGLHWIRLHYLYPDELDDQLLEVVAREEKILKYFDLPLQHISDRVLRDMNRRGSGRLIRERLDKIRALMPDAVFRTSLIVGFPGETDEEFSELYDFLREYKLERAGVFCYSQEEGSVAAELPDQVDERIKEQRRNQVFLLQEHVMHEKSTALIGQDLEVLACGLDEEGRQYGRSYMDSPDIDGVVFFDDPEVQEGTFITVRVTDAMASELFGEVIR